MSAEPMSLHNGLKSFKRRALNCMLLVSPLASELIDLSHLGTSPIVEVSTASYAADFLAGAILQHNTDIAFLLGDPGLG